MKAENDTSATNRPAFLRTSWGDFCERQAKASALMSKGKALCLSPLSTQNPLGSAFASTASAGFGLSDDAGGYVTRGGEIAGLFRHPSASVGILPKALTFARSLGGWWLNCYAFPSLLEAYERNGFCAVSLLPFSPRYAPRGWEQTTLSSRPPVAFCVDQSALEASGDAGILEAVEDWETAVMHLQRFNPRPTLSRVFVGAVGQTVAA